MRALIVLLLTLGLFATAWAGIGVDPDPLPPEQEARAQAIMRSLRCLVCQNESIADSDAELARDLRRIVRERVAAGEPDAQVETYLAARYGDWVLLQPPFKPETALLWAAPFAVLMLGGLAVLIHLRRRGRSPDGLDPRPLDAGEHLRLERALGDDG